MTALPRRVRSRLRGWSVATLVLGTLLGGTALAVDLRERAAVEGRG